MYHRPDSRSRRTPQRRSMEAPARRDLPRRSQGGFGRSAKQSRRLPFSSMIDNEMPHKGQRRQQLLQSTLRRAHDPTTNKVDAAYAQPCKCAGHRRQYRKGFPQSGNPMRPVEPSCGRTGVGPRRPARRTEHQHSEGSHRDCSSRCRASSIDQWRLQQSTLLARPITARRLAPHSVPAAGLPLHSHMSFYPNGRG